MYYFIKTPDWLMKLYPGCTWQMPGKAKTIYLTFDDGPHPVATPFVLDTLQKHQAKATFFCIGKNVQSQPGLYSRIIAEGHGVGNHTYNHLNGWKTKDEKYLLDILEAEKLIVSKLFRPPYGRIARSQLKQLSGNNFNYNTIMWTVLSGDFDTKISNEKCLQNVLKKTGKGSIVVFHDSEKAYEKLLFTLPKVLTFFSEEGYCFEKLTIENFHQCP